jgi:hypothetical protein
LGKKIVGTCKVVLSLRNAIAHDQWDNVERILYDASTNKESMIESPEIRAAHDQVNTRAKKADVQAKLDEASVVFDADTLAFELEKANALQMEVDWYTDLYYKIVDAQNMLADGIQSVEQAKLDEAVAFAESFAYNLSDYEQGRQLRDTLVAYSAELAETLKVLESREQMDELFQRCKSIGMHTAPLDELGNLLALNEEELTKKQLKAALALNDRPRVIQLNILLKEIFFRQFGNSFKISECKAIKTPQEYARGKIFGKDKAKMEMMNWQKHSIHASLTKIDPLLEKDKEACRIFKNLLGYMGDKNIQYPQMLAREIIEKGILQPEIRDEIFIQVIKQLTNNPSPESCRKGWQLMELALKHFPPSSAFENFLEIYFRQLGEPKKQYRTYLHETVFSGAKTSPPSAEKIP